MPIQGLEASLNSFVTFLGLEGCETCIGGGLAHILATLSICLSHRLLDIPSKLAFGLGGATASRPRSSIYAGATFLLYLKLNF